MPLSAAERVRRHRERQRADVMALRSVEVPRDLQGKLIAHGYLESDHIDDPERVAAAISEILDDLNDGRL